MVGFDLNPLAVMAARTNYLVAIKDLIRHVDNVEIPVYLCDSIMTPAEYGDCLRARVSCKSPVQRNEAATLAGPKGNR